MAPSLMLESVTPSSPSHWKTGLPVTPGGRETEQVRETVSPARMGEEEDEARVTFAGSGENEQIISMYPRENSFLLIVISDAVVTLLGKVLELADMLIEYMAPVISPLILTLVAVSATVSDPPSPPICW